MGNRADQYKNKQFNIVWEKIAVTAAQDLITIVAPTYAGAEMRLINLEITQDTEEGDAASEMLNILIHKPAAVGSVGSAVVPRPLNHGQTFASFGGSARQNDTTQAAEGTILWSNSFNIMAGLDRFWEKAGRDEVLVRASEIMVIELQDTPADSITMTAVVRFEINKLI